MPKILKGKFQAKRIYVPKRGNVRPLTTALRRIIFDKLGDSLNGIKVLDLYAGSGSFGLEALSRGAERVVFVDSDPIALRAIKKTLSYLGAISEKVRILEMDAFMAIRWLRGEKFDLIFIDPPYRKELVKSTLLELLSYDILKPNTLIIARYHKKQLFACPQGLKIIETKKYGDDYLSFWEVAS